MSTQIILTLPDTIYQQAQRIADSTQWEVDDVLTDVLAKNLQPFPVHPNREQMLREIEAFKLMHRQLVQDCLGQYVAIFQGKLVDHDSDPVALLQRIKQKYPDQVVLRRKVEKQPEPILHVLSPRLSK